MDAFDKSVLDQLEYYLKTGNKVLQKITEMGLEALYKNKHYMRKEIDDVYAKHE